MRYFFQLWLLVVLSIAMFPKQSQTATVNLTLYNSEALLNSDLATSLLPSFLVQLVVDGAQDGIEFPDPVGFGAPQDDDFILPSLNDPDNNPTVIGAGGAPDGFVFQINISFDDSLVGSDVYVRFWNTGSPTHANYYGNSPLLTLPSADAFGNATLEFFPLGTAASLRSTNLFFEGNSVPEPSSVVFAMMGAALIFVRRKWLNWERTGVIW